MNTTVLGIGGALNHDAAISLITGGDIKFAGHAERYSKIKNDPKLNKALIQDALQYGTPDVIAWYEDPWKKKRRQLSAGQYSEVLNMDELPKRYLKQFPELKGIPVEYATHHYSHAASGYFTSGFDDAAVVVIDSIGEYETLTIWEGSGPNLTQVYTQGYPHSLGLFYSAMTQRLGLKAQEDEYILMGMAAYGDKSEYKNVFPQVVDNLDKMTWKQNMHLGFLPEDWKDANTMDLAMAAQMTVEKCLETLMRKLSHENQDIDDCVFMGGVALNCVANTQIDKYWNRTWIMPNPGDCGSSLGAAALAYGGKLNWKGPYLGTDIPGIYPSEEICSELQKNKIVGVASGRAEFGPRALGNRSLLADPRGTEIKDRVNEIKRRQKFRPFAPMILEEHAHEYFDMPQYKTSPYMQNTYLCMHPDKFPAIVHVDGSSRVQTVGRNDKTGARELLEMWYVLTDCPMLVNTSLNIRREPMVNDRADANRFEKKYGVRVCS